MSAPAIPAPHQLHCHYCSHWLGEASAPVEFMGMFKQPKEREQVEPPRDTYRCGSCRWVNVFRRPERQGRDWRHIHLKTSS